MRKRCQTWQMNMVNIIIELIGARHIKTMIFSQKYALYAGKKYLLNFMEATISHIRFVAKRRTVCA